MSWSFKELLNTVEASDPDFTEIYLSPYEVEPSESNFYSQENIEELARFLLWPLMILYTPSTRPSTVGCCWPTVNMESASSSMFS